MTDLLDALKRAYADLDLDAEIVETGETVTIRGQWIERRENPIPSPRFDGIVEGDYRLEFTPGDPTRTTYSGEINHDGYAALGRADAMTDGFIADALWRSGYRYAAARTFDGLAMMVEQ